MTHHGSTDAGSIQYNNIHSAQQNHLLTNNGHCPYNKNFITKMLNKDWY